MRGAASCSIGSSHRSDAADGPSRSLQQMTMYYLSQKGGGGHRKALQAGWMSWVSMLVANWSLSLVDNKSMQLAACESTLWPIVQGSIRHDCHQCSLETAWGLIIHVLECVFQYYDCIMRLFPCGLAATLLRLASCFVCCEQVPTP